MITLLFQCLLEKRGKDLQSGLAVHSTEGFHFSEAIVPLTAAHDHVTISLLF